MSDAVRGPRPVAACIARRLALVGAGLTVEQYARLVRVVAEKTEWDRPPMTLAARMKVRDGCRKRDTIQAQDRPETIERT